MDECTKASADLWLVRHGETDWNREKRFQGSRDIPLNALGIQQAEESAALLRGNSFDAIYTSDLQRAFQTAQCIAERMGLKVIKERGLREIDMGIWEGKTIYDIQTQYPEQWVQWQKNPLSVVPPPGESIEHVAQRVYRAVDEIAAAHPGGRLVIVSHGISIAALICRADGIPLSEIYRSVPENTEIRRLIWKISSKPSICSSYLEK